jgi:hypothetical protein
MRRKLLIPLACLCILSCTKNKDVKQQEPIANNKALSWVKSFGGTDYDFATSVIQLQSGDYLFAGNTRSTNGDIPGTRWGYDAWLTKVDNTGNKVWSQTYGDQDDDYATSAAATPDGGFILVGYTFVNAVNRAWAIKTDAYGVKSWQKELSASTDAKALAMIPNGDGTYLIAGYTSTSGNRDGWIKKIDAAGNQLWNKNFGGSAEDWFTAIVKNTDGSYSVAGYTNSRDGDIASTKGSFDGWIMRIDASGNKLWSKNFGGSGDDFLNGIIKTPDGGIIAAGNSRSSDGDIATNQGSLDEWIIKLDAAGNKSWIKTYGGGNEEYITSISPTANNDGGFYTLGYTNSTTGDVFRPNNNYSGWLLKLDSDGNKKGASTYGHTSLYDDKTNALIPTQDGGYMIGGFTWQEGRGYDAWLVKIGDLQ